MCPRAARPSSGLWNIVQGPLGKATWAARSKSPFSLPVGRLWGSPGLPEGWSLDPGGHRVLGQRHLFHLQSWRVRPRHRAHALGTADSGSQLSLRPRPAIPADLLLQSLNKSIKDTLMMCSAVLGPLRPHSARELGSSLGRMAGGTWRACLWSCSQEMTLDHGPHAWLHASPPGSSRGLALQATLRVLRAPPRGVGSWGMGQLPAAHTCGSKDPSQEQPPKPAQEPGASQPKAS